MEVRRLGGIKESKLIFKNFLLTHKMSVYGEKRAAQKNGPMFGKRV